MSEYQYVEFRAVDRPLTNKELAYAEKQSSRAEITRWRFSNEYNYSSFRGNVDGLLRRGYDVFLEYANYGTRTIKISLPSGLPFENKLARKFIDGQHLKWKQDPKSQAGILTLEPFFEPGDSYWEFENCLDEVVAIRQRLIGGDLRALYVLWLCVAGDHNYDPAGVIEPPVPLGLEHFDNSVDDLFEFYDIDPLLLNAAAGETKLTKRPAKTNSTLPKVFTPADRLKPWLDSIGVKLAKEHLVQLLTGDTASVKADILAAIAKDKSGSIQVEWPTTELNRSFEELMERADVLRVQQQAIDAKKEAAKAKRDAAKAQREHDNRMAEMIKNPQKWLDESERLVEARGTSN